MVPQRGGRACEISQRWSVTKTGWWWMEALVLQRDWWVHWGVNHSLARVVVSLVRTLGLRKVRLHSLGAAVVLLWVWAVAVH